MDKYRYILDISSGYFNWEVPEEMNLLKSNKYFFNEIKKFIKENEDKNELSNPYFYNRLFHFIEKLFKERDIDFFYNEELINISFEFMEEIKLMIDNEELQNKIFTTINEAFLNQFEEGNQDKSKMTLNYTFMIEQLLKNKKNILYHSIYEKLKEININNKLYFLMKVISERKNIHFVFQNDKLVNYINDKRKVDDLIIDNKDLYEIVDIFSEKIILDEEKNYLYSYNKINPDFKKNMNYLLNLKNCSVEDCINFIKDKESTKTNLLLSLFINNDDNNKEGRNNLFIALNDEKIKETAIVNMMLSSLSKSIDKDFLNNNYKFLLNLKSKANIEVYDLEDKKIKEILTFLKEKADINYFLTSNLLTLLIEQKNIHNVLKDFIIENKDYFLNKEIFKIYANVSRNKIRVVKHNINNETNTTTKTKNILLNSYIINTLLTVDAKEVLNKIYENKYLNNYIQYTHYLNELDINYLNDSFYLNKDLQAAFLKDKDYVNLIFNNLQNKDKTAIKSFKYKSNRKYQNILKLLNFYDNDEEKIKSMLNDKIFLVFFKELTDFNKTKVKIEFNNFVDKLLNFNENISNLVFTEIKKHCITENKEEVSNIIEQTKEKQSLLLSYKKDNLKVIDKLKI